MGAQKDKSLHTRQMLAEAAAALFQEHGFEQVGVREIAAAAGVTTGSFYHHFKNKTDVINEIYENKDLYFGQVLRRLQTDNPDPQAILDFFLNIMVPIVEKDGRDFTLHRMFGLKKHSTTKQELYLEMIRLIEMLQARHQMSDHYTAEAINEHLFLVFRGVLYEWTIRDDSEPNGSLAVLMKQHMTPAIRAFRLS